MKLILIDTNAWMAIALWKIDLFEEVEKAADFPHEIAILQGTQEELKKIQNEQPGKFRNAAKLALALLKAKKVKIIRGTGSVDNLLVHHSHQGDVVLTQDQQLKKRLSRPYFTLRQKKRVVQVR